MGFVIRLPLKTVTISRFTILSSSSVWGLTHLVVGAEGAQPPSDFAEERMRETRC